jgi:membrane-associated phospholipid phosphatase
MRWPAARSRGALLVAGAVTVLLCSLMYSIPQHVHLAMPLRLPLTAVDRAIPFWPLSGLVYFGVFVFMVASFLTLRSARAWRFLYASLVAQAIGMLCFLLWPTSYPRELYPLPASTGALGAALVHFVRTSDAPVNCLPSLHVCTVTLCVLALRGSRWFRPAAILALPLAASTLTFKQHYLVDAITGAALGGIAWWLVRGTERDVQSRAIKAGP